MAENQVQIEVELVGQKEVGKGLQNITKGAEGVGETFKGVGSIVGKTNKQLGEGLSSVSDALGESMNAVSGVKDAFSALGQSGAISFTSLLGPIGLVVTAIGAAYEAYRQLSGAAQEAENRQEAMAAASGDLSSKLEALAEGGVVPTAQELERFAKITLQTQVAKELLIKRTEKLIPLIEAETTAEKELEKATALHLRTQRLFGEVSREASAALHAVIDAEYKLGVAQAKRNEMTNEINEASAKNLAGIAAAAEQEKALEEQTTDNLRAKFKENAERLKTVELLRLESGQLDELTQALIKDNVETEHTISLLGLEDKSRAELIEMIKGQKDAVEGLREEEAIREANMARQVKLEQDAAKKAREERQRAWKEAQAKRDAEAKAAAAAEQQRLAMQSQINLLDIQLTKDGEAQKLALIEERHRAGIEIAKDDAMKRAVVDKAYELELKKLNEERATKDAEESAKRIERQKAEARAAMDLRHESLQFDAEHLQNTLSLWESFKGNLWFSTEETDRQLLELETRYEKEYELAEGNLARQTELTRRYEIEQTEITRQQAQARGEVLKGILDMYGQGLAEATVASLMFGESFNVVVAKALDGMAKQSAVRALMEVAEGLGALALGSPTAGAHFAAAAKFGAAAALAGAVSAATGQSAIGGANKNTATPTSPTGTPQTSTAPQRERAETSTIVYNVNFGGAVVYDTKRAAEMAMTQRLDRRRGEMRGAR